MAKQQRSLKADCPQAVGSGGGRKAPDVSLYHMSSGSEASMTVGSQTLKVIRESYKKRTPLYEREKPDKKQLRRVKPFPLIG